MKRLAHSVSSLLMAGILALLPSEAMAQAIYDDSNLAPSGLEIVCHRPDLPVFNVKHYGAQGDGVADDTKAIRKALAKAVSARGGIIYFPQGTYAVCCQPEDAMTNGLSAIFPITTSNLIFQGEGPGKTHLSGRMPGLQDPVTTWTLTNKAYSKIHRFAMFGLAPDKAPSTGVQFRSLEIVGNAGYTGNFRVGGVPETGDGWDMSHKGIALVGQQPSDALIFNCSVDQWRGEVIYGGGNQGKVAIIKSHVFSSNASAVSVSGDVLIDHSIIGGTDPGDDVYNGVENFCIDASQKTVMRDSQIIPSPNPAKRHGNGIAFLGVRDASLLVERTTFQNSAFGILFSDLAHNVVLRNCSFTNNGNATITSSQGLYPRYKAEYGFGNFLFEHNNFDRSGAALLLQFYGKGQPFDRLVLRGNTVSNGVLLGGAFYSPLDKPFTGFVMDGNSLGLKAGDADYTRKPKGGTIANYALWTNTIRSNPLATSCQAINGNKPAPNNTLLHFPATDITVVGDHPPSIPVTYLTMDPATLPGYPTGFTTTYLPQSGAEAWALKADPTWNTFPQDQPIPAAGLTIRKTASGKFELAPSPANSKQQ